MLMETYSDLTSIANNSGLKVASSLSTYPSLKLALFSIVEPAKEIKYFCLVSSRSGSSNKS